MTIRTNGHHGARHDLGGTEGRPCPDEGGDVALGIWVLVSLAGIGAGLAVAKYSQAWSGDPLHSSAFIGALLVCISVLLGQIAACRYVTPRSASRRPSRWLAIFSGTLSAGLGWIALAMIFFAN